jgi:5-methyltetrahydropteroyltriglutamate--homocysteine methyltransferase
MARTFAMTARFDATIVGSLPKPTWLAEPNKLWAPWRLEGEDLARAKRDATILVLKLQEDAGLAIVTDGEQSRKHFVHGFLEFVEGVDFAHQVAMGIRNNRYTAMVPTVTSAVRLKGRVHQTEALVARAHTTRKLKITLPGPMTICDTIADQDHHYRDRAEMAFAFADLLNQEARALEADGVDVIQLDEPAFNVFMSEVNVWGVQALERAVAGLKCMTCVHICYGYGIKANLEWKASLGGKWTQYEETFPSIARSSIKQVSVEARNSRVPLELLALLPGKDVLLGVIDVANDTVETAEEVFAVIEKAAKFVPPERILPSTNCGMAPMRWDLAFAKLNALGAGAALARQRLG